MHRCDARAARQPRAGSAAWNGRRTPANSIAAASGCGCPGAKPPCCALVQHPNRARTKQALLQAVFGRDDMTGDALEVVAFRLRQKIAARCGVAIVTLRGLGYLIKARREDG